MIRHIQEREIEVCVNVIKRSFLTVALEYGFTVKNAPRFTAFAINCERLQNQYAEGRPMYGYFDENEQLIGYYSLHITECDKCELNNLCVLPEHRHKAVGEKLFAHALFTASEKQCKEVNIGIVEENQKLRTWYEQFGAKHIGTKKYDFFPFTCGYMKIEPDTKANNKIEFWDAYTASGTLAECDLIRGEAVPENLRHAVAEVFVMHEDGSILLMKRDMNKPNYPGLWESAAGGSVIKGESFIEGAKRELSEETGIAGVKLQEIYSVTTKHTIYRGYFCVTDIEKNSITLQKGETIDFKWVDKQEFFTIFNSEQYVDSLRERLHEFVIKRFAE